MLRSFPAAHKSTQEKMKLVIYTAILVYGHRTSSWVLAPKLGETMVTRRISPKARRGRNHRTRSVDHVYGVPVPEGLHEAIENERGNLSRAESVLGCLAISMED